MVTAADGVCTHLRMLPLVVAPRDGDGDFERGGEAKSRGCWRVDTMACGGLEALTVVVAGMNATLEVPQAATVSL